MKRTLYLCFLSLFFASVTSAFMVLEKNLPSIVEQSEIAARVKCEKAEVKTLSNGLVATEYTFKVDDALKGNVGKEIKFLQHGASNSSRAKKNITPMMVGFTNFEVGREYVLFLSSEHEGVRNPIGLSQGVFKVVRSADGRAQVVNGFSNKNLFKNLPSGGSVSKAMKAGRVDEASPPKGPVNYDDFKAIVEGLK